MGQNRVIRTTPDRVRAALWDEVGSAGIDRDFFTALLAEYGHEAVIDWLREHNFWDVRAAYGNAYYLLDGQILEDVG